MGLALALFFLLLIALSEHLPFVAAYGIAAAGCIALIGTYLAGALGGTRPALAFAGGLTGLYGVLYGVLLSEDNSCSWAACCSSSPWAPSRSPPAGWTGTGSIPGPFPSGPIDHGPLSLPLAFPARLGAAAGLAALAWYLKHPLMLWLRAWETPILLFVGMAGGGAGLARAGAAPGCWDSSSWR